MVEISVEDYAQMSEEEVRRRIRLYELQEFRYLGAEYTEDCTILLPGQVPERVSGRTLLDFFLNLDSITLGNQNN